MAEVNTDKGKGDGKKGKQKKVNIRVDFTPMVDMNMLLITFFMLCTSLSSRRPWRSVCRRKTMSRKPNRQK